MRGTREEGGRKRETDKVTIHSGCLATFVSRRMDGPSAAGLRGQRRARGDKRARCVAFIVSARE